MNSETNSKAILLETQYLPPVSAFVRMQSFSAIVIDGEENFRKSTWRNRCTIINANGPLLLTIPIVGGRGVRSKTRDVRIANDEPWQHIHWRSMMAAYGKSSFFIFYEEKFRKHYEKRFDFLLDFNAALLESCFQILQWEKVIMKDNSMEQSEATSNSKLQTLNFKTYHQVFDSKHGFIADVSIVDLIFNLGNMSGEYLSLRKSV